MSKLKIYTYNEWIEKYNNNEDICYVYKVVNYKDNKYISYFNKFEYKIGINEDIIEYNENTKCIEGGLYFTNLENLYMYYNAGIFGSIVLICMIPKDALFADTYNTKIAWRSNKLDVKYIIHCYTE